MLCLAVIPALCSYQHTVTPSLGAFWHTVIPTFLLIFITLGSISSLYHIDKSELTPVAVPSYRVSIETVTVVWDWDGNNMDSAFDVSYQELAQLFSPELLGFVYGETTLTEVSTNLPPSCPGNEASPTPSSPTSSAASAAQLLPDSRFGKPLSYEELQKPLCVEYRKTHKR